MILSVSRRTDIPAFYTEWFMNRIHEKYVLTRNPMNYHQVSRTPITPDVVDFIVFWSKNPAPLLPYLDEIGRDYPFYFQFTLILTIKTLNQISLHRRKELILSDAIS
jgi:hypothetical protein